MINNLFKTRSALQLTRINLTPGKVFILILVFALVAFEMFNYSTTDFALKDMLGDLRFAGIPWSTILAVAFCGIDFAGIARLFTPQQGAKEPKEVWYLFGAWLLAATMNALLTWWGVSMAVVSHPVQSSAVMNPVILTKAVPAFVAIMVWVIRILIIGTLSVAGDKLLWNSTPAQTRRPVIENTPSPTYRGMPPAVAPSRPMVNRPANTAHTPRNFSSQ